MGSFPLIDSFGLNSTGSSSWTTVGGSLPPGADSDNNEKAFHREVSCPTTTDCTVVGDYSAGNYLPLVQTLGQG